MINNNTGALGYIAMIISFVGIVSFFLNGCADTVQGFHTNSDGQREGFGDNLLGTFIILGVALALYLIDKSISK